MRIKNRATHAHYTSQKLYLRINLFYILQSPSEPNSYRPEG